MKKLNTCCVVLGATLLATASASAATSIDLRQQPVSYLQSFLSANTAVAQPQLKVVSQHRDFNQVNHMKMDQYFNGIPVIGAQAIVHVPQGKSLTTAGSTMNGTLYQDLQKDLSEASPVVFTDAQAEKALDHAVSLYGKNKNLVSNGKSKLMIYVDKTDHKAHYAFVVSFKVNPASGLPAKPTYILNAEHFTVYANWDDIKTVDTVDGGGFGGNLKTGIQTFDGGAGHFEKLSMTRDTQKKMCYLKNDAVEVTNTKNVPIQFLCGSTDSKHNNVYWDGMKDGANFGFSPGNDALYDGKVIKAMYQEWYNVPALKNTDGSPMVLKMRVHAFMDNAYFDEEEAVMTFGDGIVMFYPLTSLDVGAHEISHGFTAQHSNLVYNSESGGINEAFSDMAGEAAKYYSTGKNDWQVGATIFKAANQALRYLDEPTKDCNGRRPGDQCSISNIKDYDSELDVHFSSGIFNKAFYEIATQPEWNTKKAFDLMVKANMDYWTASVGFADAACGVLAASQDYKYNSTVVVEAFEKVGIHTSLESCHLKG
jgi:pseudolysin